MSDNYQTIAKLIPKEFRDEILAKNHIANASTDWSNNATVYLHTIWQEYVEPGIGTCPVCLDRVLKNFRELQQTFINLARAENLLAGA